MSRLRRGVDRTDSHPFLLIGEGLELGVGRPLTQEDDGRGAGAALP